MTKNGHSEIFVWKNEICEKSNFVWKFAWKNQIFTRIHDPQISNQIDAAGVLNTDYTSSELGDNPMRLAVCSFYSGEDIVLRQ